MKYDFKASEIENLSSEEKEEFVINWFREFHEDPANETPWVEGEYFYAYGGPYYTSDVLHDHFSELLDSDEIEKVTNQLEADGTLEWAPSGKHPDQIQAYEDYLQPEAEWLHKHSAVQDAEIALLELSDMALSRQQEPSDALILRMIFVQCWSILESFISSILKKHLLEDQVILKRLSLALPGIRDFQFTGKELARKDNILLAVALEHVDRTSFYDVDKIRLFLEAAFGKFTRAEIDVDDELEEIKKLASKRHDCVHRNGKTVEDTPTGVDSNDVECLIVALRSFVPKTGALVARKLYKQEGEAQ